MDARIATRLIACIGDGKVELDRSKGPPDNKRRHNSVLTYYLQDDVGGALGLLSNALSSIDKLSGVKPLSSIRFLRDMSGIAPDFHILSNILEGFRESSRTRPKGPETDKSWSPELWLDYFREQVRADFSLVGTLSGQKTENEYLNIFNNDISIIGQVTTGSGVYMNDNQNKLELKFSGWNYFSN